MKKQNVPSPEQIQDYLEGLNRHCRTHWSPTGDAERAWQQGFGNYQRWFKSHGIAIYQDDESSLWKLKQRKRSNESL